MLKEIKDNSTVDTIREALVGSWESEDTETYSKCVLKNLVIVIPKTDCIVSLDKHPPFWYDGALVPANRNKLRISRIPLIYARYI